VYLRSQSVLWREIFLRMLRFFKMYYIAPGSYSLHLSSLYLLWDTLKYYVMHSPGQVMLSQLKMVILIFLKSSNWSVATCVSVMTHAKITNGPSVAKSNVQFPLVICPSLNSRTQFTLIFPTEAVNWSFSISLLIP
jgi:hypothetical protein